MVKEEVCSFMVFDSSGVGEDRIREFRHNRLTSWTLTKTGTPPHSAFWHSKKWRLDKRPRESIEVRLLVLTALK
jgi:hypothetical protein